MTYDFSPLEKKIADIEEWLKREYFGIRTGKATPSILDSVRVDSYGSQVPINQVATVSVEDARTIRILPYDATQVKEIEKAIAGTNLGLSTSSDEKGLRVIFPELTSDNRKALAKVVREKLEQAKISIRTERDNVWGDIQKQEKDGELSEDEKFTYKDDMQKLIDEGVTTLEGLSEKKEQEVMG